MAAMGSRQLTGSPRGPRWWDFMQVVHQAGYALLCLLRCPTPKCPPGRRLPIDLMYIMYEIHLRMENLSLIRRRVCKGLLASVFFVCTFTAFFFSFTSGGDRWVLNPLISDFEYPLIPEHALKVFIFCKYSFAICMVYNLMRYAVDRKEEMVALMDSLEREAAMLLPGQSTESRLDACVPRITDDANVQEARQLVAMRRLLHRGVFTFDVVPEPEPVEEPEPSEDELQAVREAMELEAVKRLNDPKMLREYIRRRESRQGRRRVHLYKMKERRNKATRSKGLRVESPLNVIEEEETSLTQFSPEMLRDFRRLSTTTQKAVAGKLTSQRLLQKLQHGKTESRSEMKWGISGLSSLKADGDNLDIDIRDLFPNVPSTERHRGLTDFLPCVMSRQPASSIGSAAGAVSTSGGRAPLQAAKWPVSGTCRPTRSRPPSPSATQTLLTRASRSSSAAADSNAASRTHTPATRSRMASGGTVSEPPSAPTPSSVARERPGRPVRPGFGHSPSPPVTPPPTPPVRPKTPRRSTTPPSSLPSSRQSSPPTTPPSPRARRRPAPGVRTMSPMDATYIPTEEVIEDTIIIDKAMTEREPDATSTGKPINATPTHIIVSHIPRSISPTQPITRKTVAPERPSPTRTSPSPPLRPTPPPTPRPTATQPRSKSIARPPSTGRGRTPTPVGKKTAPTAMGGSSTPSSATASATGGTAGTRTPSGARSAGGTAGSGTPSIAGSVSSATTGPLGSGGGVCVECSSISSNQSSAAQGSLSSTAGTAKVASPERTLPAASSGVTNASKSRLSESIYSAWRESIATKRNRGALSPKGTPLAVNKFQTTTGPPQIRAQAKSRERRPVVVRTGREAAIKSAEGTRIWRHDRRSDRRSERRPEQKDRPEKKPEQRPDMRSENRSEPSSKELKKSETTLVKEIFDFSNPTSESEGTSEVSKVEDVNDAGGDMQNDVQVILQKKSSVVSQKGKKEVEISNLLEPRADWSDSASSLSGVSPSLTSTVRAFSDLVAANISQESSEELNGDER